MYGGCVAQHIKTIWNGLQDETTQDKSTTSLGENAAEKVVESRSAQAEIEEDNEAGLDSQEGRSDDE